MPITDIINIEKKVLKNNDKRNNKRGDFNRRLKNILFQLVNAYAEDQKELTGIDLIDKIRFRPLYEDIKFQRNNDDEKEKKEIKEIKDLMN